MAKEQNKLSATVQAAVESVQIKRGAAWIKWGDMAIGEREWNAAIHSIMLANVVRLLPDRKEHLPVLMEESCITEQSNFKKRLISLGLMGAASKEEQLYQ